jgi:hypothetical protein
MKRITAVLAVCVCLTSTAMAWIEETGTLRGILLGHCVGCAYDNWTSHVVEGLATPGYNDYGPSWFDPQTVGFGHFTYLPPNDTAANRTLSQWRSVFSSAAHGLWAQVDSALATHTGTWRYDLVRLQDTELNRTFFVIRERLDSSFVDPNVDSIATDDVIGSFDNGWGIFVFNTAPLFPKLAIQVVHPDDDFMAIPVAIELFIRTNARALMMAGAGREVLWPENQTYNNSNTLSDPSRNGRLPFEMCHEAMFDALDGGPTSQYVTVQMHSYDHYAHRSSSDIEVSAFADDSKPNPPLRDRAEHLDLIHFIGQWPVQGIPGHPEVTNRIDHYVGLLSSPQYAFYGASDTIPIPGVSQPGAGGNQQASYSHRSHNADRDPENFIHVEVDEYPDGLWFPENWHQWLPGNMPATMETYSLALAYYEPFIAAMDSALRQSHLYADVTPPLTVHLDQVTNTNGDTLRLQWSPAAADRFFDSYYIYYDTLAIRPSSPFIWRGQSGNSALQDFATTSWTVRGLPLPVYRYRFAVGSRDIFGNEAQLSNVVGTTGENVGLQLADAYTGWGDACRSDTLYLTFNQTGFLAGQMFVVLPPAFEAAWTVGNQPQNLMPSANAAANLMFSTGRRFGSGASDTLEVNVQWGPPYSDGNGTRFIAAIPIHNQSAMQTATFTIRGLDSTLFYDLNGAHVRQFTLGTATIYNDCAAPTTALSFGTTPSCAFGSATALEGQFSIGLQRGSVLSNAPLANGYVEINGEAQRRVNLFAATLPGNYSNASFPNSADAETMWGYLSEGCNNIVVHGFDTECNEGLSATLVVVKDMTAPELTVTNSDTAFCYNNVAGSTHFGATALDEQLDISTVLNGGSCSAATGTVTISYAAHSYAPIGIPPDLAGYPASDMQGAALWTWITSVVPTSANGERYEFAVRAEDCAGNVRDTTISLKIDLTPPTNSVTHLDARPTDMGVWLNWTWQYDAVQAVSMEIWRSSYAGDYPAYAANHWANLADSAAYPRAYPPSGFVRVVEQSGLSGTTSAAYTQLNGKGRLVHGGPDSSYWKDEDATWQDESEHRGIYRYITFVKDAAGNASLVSGYGLNTNADRSTNYWLGDYSRDASPDPNGSSGIVNTQDIALLSAYYFMSVPQAPGYLDIGPENAENGYGKGIPSPDGQIDFLDLVPFSMNFGTTGQNSYSTQPTERGTKDNLNEPVVVKVLRVDPFPINVGDEFSVSVSLAGSGVEGVRALETRLCFDGEILELLTTEADSVDVKDGIPFTSIRTIPGECETVGIAAAAIGENGHLAGAGTVARFRFLWKNVHAATASITLQNTRVAAINGLPRDAESQRLDLTALNAIPICYALYQNFPNPFNPTTQIRFDLADNAFTRLDIFNCLGQHVATLMNEQKAAGTYTVNWNGRNDRGTMMAAGVYIYRMQAGKYVASRKMVLLK